MKRHRDEEFFKKNIAALYGDVYRFARAMTDDALSAQDITQNTMETAWRKSAQTAKPAADQIVGVSYCKRRDGQVSEREETCGSFL